MMTLFDRVGLASKDYIKLNGSNPTDVFLSHADWVWLRTRIADERAQAHVRGECMGSNEMTIGGLKVHVYAGTDPLCFASGRK